ncbi:hypothetical protein K0M31_005996 [Melipona bicolor]|uniref:PTHB1 N-terminal domain-containing protein n=1 Tax=Melipona bicolor TaxID=60889 RepID=A0AA40FTJ3_9HYME|nr:hypothetical protein K0M31_005996 [Melipona bicolor]
MPRGSSTSRSAFELTLSVIIGIIGLTRCRRRSTRAEARFSEPDGKLMVLVIADTSTLMIYEGSTLRWSAQLPFAPVTVARVQLEVSLRYTRNTLDTTLDTTFVPSQHLHGVIVILSADGRLEACYLGSEPSLFVAPPLHPRGYDYAAAERELSELRATVSSNSKQTGERVRSRIAPMITSTRDCCAKVVDPKGTTNHRCAK